MFWDEFGVGDTVLRDRIHSSAQIPHYGSCLDLLPNHEDGFIIS